MSIKLCSIAIAATMAIMIMPAVLATEVVLERNQISNLGIEVASPQLSNHQVSIEANASVAVPPNQEFFVGPMQAGVIARLNVMPGDTVHAGQDLAHIRSADFLALQRKFVDAAIQRWLLEAQLERDQSLFADGTVSQRRLQETRAKTQAALAVYRAHQQMLRLANMNDDEINKLEQNQKLTDVLVLRSPSDGVVLDVMARVGEPVDALIPIYQLADPSTLWLSIQLPVEHVTMVVPGSEVKLLGELAGVTAKVTGVGQAVDPETQTLRVRAQIDRRAERVKPGQFVAVGVQSGNAEAQSAPTWQIPTSAVVHGDWTDIVFVKSSQGFEAQAVQVVGESRGWTYVTGALADSSLVAIAGVTALKSLWLEQISEGD